jgi:hypothetical protein
LVTRADLRKLVRDVLREELTSGDSATRKLLTEILLSIVLKDSTGAELSSYVKNLDVALSTIKSQTDKLNFDSGNRLRVSPASAEAMIPTETQSRYKPPGITLYSGTVTSSSASSSIDVGASGIGVAFLEIELKVTGVSGTNPTLSVYIEGLFETTGDWKPLVYQEDITSTGIWYFTITQLAFRYIRVRWAVSGTSPSFTFTVAGQAMV